MVKNVLRYPGGKSKAIKMIIPNIPANIKEFREPMVGGGSVSLVVKQLFPNVKVILRNPDFPRNFPSFHTGFKSFSF